MIALSVTLVSVAQSATPVQTTNPNATSTVVTSIPKTDWLHDFNVVKVDGPMNVVFKRVAKAEEVRITYDTKGCITSKFKAELNRNGELVVSEKSDPKRETTTDVTIYYRELSYARVAHAKAEFSEVIDRKIFDLAVSGGAIVRLDIKTLDLAVECTGRSLLTLSGDTKYLTMKCSTATVNGAALYTVSSTVEVSHSAEVRLNVSERLEATTSTGGKLLYKGTPVILRDHTSLFGGDLININ